MEAEVPSHKKSTKDSVTEHQERQGTACIFLLKLENEWGNFLPKQPWLMVEATNWPEWRRKRCFTTLANPPREIWSRSTQCQTLDHHSREIMDTRRLRNRSSDTAATRSTKNIVDEERRNQWEGKRLDTREIWGGDRRVETSVGHRTVTIKVVARGRRRWTRRFSPFSTVLLKNSWCTLELL